MEVPVPSPQTTLLILLGASEWPLFPEFQDSEAFANAARELKAYFLDPKRFGVWPENILDVFNANHSPDEQDAQIGQFLERRLAAMKATGHASRDLLVYFVGHGGFVGRDSDFYLAIRRTRMENPRASGIPMLSLADTLTEKARYLRRIIILDCCFAAAAFSAFQAGPAQVAIEKTKDAFEVKQRGAGFPAKGTTLLCSSSQKAPSLLLPDGSSTMFTKALLDALAEGLPPQRERLSLREVKDIAAGFLSETRNAPRPVVLSPDQSEGDVADIPFFPNPRAEEEQARQAEEERVRKAKETALAATELATSAHQTPLPTEVARSSKPPVLRRFVLLGLAGLVIVALASGIAWFTAHHAAPTGGIHATPTGGIHAAPAGSITEFPVLTAKSNPDGIAAGPDGNLWFTYGDSKIGRITTAGTITEYPIPAVGLGGITAGPDRNLWFTEQNGNKIGRISPSGAITEFPIPTAQSYPWRITAGPDRNLWFIEYSGNKIGRISPSGTITEFPVPIAQSYYLWGITAGPDGNLWFTEPPGNKIGRISPSGAITEFPVPTAKSDPLEITAGPDGNLWFTEHPGNKIGRISPSGTITEFPVPTARSNPWRIAAGPDGNLWFTEYSGNKIGRISPSGTITEFPVPTTKSNPDGIAAGPDGNLWFTEFDGNKIGRITSGK